MAGQCPPTVATDVSHPKLQHSTGILLLPSHNLKPPPAYCMLHHDPSNSERHRGTRGRLTLRVPLQWQSVELDGEDKAAVKQRLLAAGAGDPEALFRSAGERM